MALDLPVGPGYFDVMGIALVDGRLFTDRDLADAPQVMIVSESLARQMFPNQRAVGQQLRFFSSRPGGMPPPAREIVGVVRDVRQDGIAQAPIMQMYAPYAQNAWSFVSFFVLADGDPTQHAATVQRVVNTIDPMRPVRDVLTLDRHRFRIDGAPPRHDLDAHRPGGHGPAHGDDRPLRRERDRGVGAAARAGHSRGGRGGAVQPARPDAAAGPRHGRLGVGAGSAVSLAATRGLGALLYETAPRDPLTFIGTAALLLAVAAVATYLPARRVVGANLAEVLRAD